MSNTADSDFLKLNQTSIEGHELDYMRQAVEGSHTSASGPFSKRARGMINDWAAAREVLLTTSCTAALEMSALLLDIEPGDKVIVPSFTFVSSALAFVRAGAEVVFADIERDTLALDPDSVENLIDDRVKAVVTVHYGGIAGRIEELAGLIPERASLIEDNAHGLFAMKGDRPLGSFGRFSTLSFHDTKNFTCGEGGALIINEPDDVGRAWTVYDKGTDRQAFFRGEVDKYTWRDMGSSFGLSDVLAAYLVGQLEQKERILSERKRVFDRYMRLLEPHAESLGVTLPSVPDDSVPGYHLFYVLMPDAESRSHVLKSLREAGIGATFHYVPLHESPGGEEYGVAPQPLPVTESVASRLIRLPFFNSLSDSAVDRVVTEFIEVAGK